MKHIHLFCLLLFILVYIPSIYPKAVAIGGEGEAGIEPLEIGNFILPTTQEPGPLFGFGQNIIDAKDLQVYIAPNKFGGHDFHYSEILFYILYGITDYLSVFLALPVALNRTIIANQSTTKARFFNDPALSKSGPFFPIIPLANISSKSSGLEDMSLQLEYAYYNKKTLISEFQTTAVATIFFPTGSAFKLPPTGFGSTAFFFGTTVNYQSLFWFVYAAIGGIVTTKKDDVRFGNSFLYQCGIEGVIGTLDEKKWLFAWVFELFGIRLSNTVVSGKSDVNTGGNTIFAAPSLWVSSKHTIFQIGVGVPVFQKLNGIQNKTSYFLYSQAAWTFNLQ